RDLHPHFRRAEPASSCWTSSPILQRSARDLNPAFLLTTEECHRNTCRPSDPGWTRTIVAWMWARSLCRWTTGSISVAEVGIEPTNSHQALDLAALPICVLGHQVAEAGFEPASNGL